MGSKKIAYFGTPEEAVTPLEALAEAGHRILLVVTAGDKPRGRGQKVSPSPVKKAAKNLRLPVSHNPGDVVGLGADLGVVVAYGRLITEDVLAEMPLVNMHFSLLPRWRGAAPVERAILAGDEKTGVCLMAVEPTLDTGGVYLSAETPINSNDTAASLKSRLVDMGTELLLELANQELPLPEPAPQKGEPVWADKISKDELKIDAADSPETAHRKVRAGAGAKDKAGGAWIMLNQKRIKITEAEPASAPDADESEAPPISHRENIQDQDKGQKKAAETSEMVEVYKQGEDVILALADGGLKLIRVLPEGKKEMSAEDWYRGQEHSG